MNESQWKWSQPHFQDSYNENSYVSLTTKYELNIQEIPIKLTAPIKILEVNDKT